MHRRQVQVYIHPDDGPISPMILDLDAVEVAMNKLPAASVSDEVVVREIARQIRVEFVDLTPDDQKGQRQLVMIMRRWVNLQGFVGIVLRLTGSIKNSTSGKLAANQLQQSPAELTRLTNMLEKERRNKEALQLRLHGLETESRRFKALYERTSNELVDQRVQAKLAQDDAALERRATQRAREDASQAIRESGKYKIQVEQLQREQQQRPTQPQLEKELATLRYKERSMRETEQQLREALAASQQENLALRQQIVVLTEGLLTENAPVEKDDPYDL